MDELKKLGYDITWIAEENPSLDDISIFKIAQKENRILLTNDKDFGDIVFRQKLVSSGIVLFRIKGQDTREKIKLLTKVLVSHKDRISKHFVVITKEKFRFTPISYFCRRCQRGKKIIKKNRNKSKNNVW